MRRRSRAGDGLAKAKRRKTAARKTRIALKAVRRRSFAGTDETKLARVIRERDQGSRAFHLFVGVINIILGIILVGHIGTSEDILRIVLGLWFLFSGISLMSFSRFTGPNWLLTAGGVIVVLFALAIIFKPLFGAITIDLLIAVGFITTGLFELILGYRLKK